MTNWHDKSQPDTDSAVYVTGWTVSGLAVLGAIWLSGFLVFELDLPRGNHRNDFRGLLA